MAAFLSDNRSQGITGELLILRLSYNAINSDILTQAKTKEVHRLPGSHRLMFGRAPVLTKEKLSTKLSSRKAEKEVLGMRTASQGALEQLRGEAINGERF